MSHVYNSYLFYAIFFRDIAKYNTDDDLEESIEETGWKLVHGDVFRPPQVKSLHGNQDLSTLKLRFQQKVAHNQSWPKNP